MTRRPHSTGCRYLMRCVAVAGSVAQKPGHGGHTWVFLQYLLGFRRLGWDVLFLDRLDPAACTDDTAVGPRGGADGDHTVLVFIAASSEERNVSVEVISVHFPKGGG